MTICSGPVSHSLPIVSHFHSYRVSFSFLTCLIFILLSFVEVFEEVWKKMGGDDVRHGEDTDDETHCGGTDGELPCGDETR